MKINKKRPWDLPESAATPESVFKARRRFIKALGLGTIASAGVVAGARFLTRFPITPRERIDNFMRNAEFIDAGRPLTREDTVYRFNNFYEFAIDKTSVARKCRNFRLDPWALEIDGLVARPQKFGFEDILKMQLEQRVYRFRCVEAWAMTVPWVGLPLGALLERAEPDARAKFISFESFYAPDLAPNQRKASFPWPYKEALTLAEAMNPLAFVAIGLYGRYLQPQNGAPMRIVLPWKYGYKGPKSVVRMTFTSQRPATFWNTVQPHEYGFYGNVNPALPHPRWSQRREALLGTWGRRVDTQKYNGYGRWVSHLYDKDEY